MSILVHSVASGWWEKNNPKPSPWISCTKPLHWWDLWQLPPYINEQMIVPKKNFNICKPKIIIVTNDWSINRITTYIELPHSTHIYSKFRTPATNSKPCRYPAPTWELACCSLSEGRDVDFRTVDGRLGEMRWAPNGIGLEWVLVGVGNPLWLFNIHGPGIQTSTWNPRLARFCVTCRASQIWPHNSQQLIDTITYTDVTMIFLDVWIVNSRLSCKDISKPTFHNYI